jgi:hypothetical protein
MTSGLVSKTVAKVQEVVTMMIIEAMLFIQQSINSL